MHHSQPTEIELPPHSQRSMNTKATVCEPAKGPTAPLLLLNKVLNIILKLSEYHEKSAKLVTLLHGENDLEEHPTACGSIKDAEHRHWLSCTTDELTDYLAQPNFKSQQLSTIHIRDRRTWKLQSATAAFLQWVDNGGHVKADYNDQEVHFNRCGPRHLSSDGFLVRFDARQDSDGLPHTTGCLKIRTSGRALQDAVPVPGCLRLLSCSLLQSLEHRILDQSNMPPVDPLLRTVLYRESGAFEPWRAEHAMGIWIQVIKGWTLFLRYMGPSDEQAISAVLSGHSVRDDHVQSTLVGPGDVLVLRPETANPADLQPIVYCSLVLQDTLAIRGPIWPNAPAQLLATLKHIGDCRTGTQDNKTMTQQTRLFANASQLQLYPQALKDFFVQQNQKPPEEEEDESPSPPPTMSVAIDQLLGRQRYTNEEKTSILNQLDPMIAEQRPTIKPRGTKNVRRSVRLAPPDAVSLR